MSFGEWSRDITTTGSYAKFTGDERNCWGIVIMGPQQGPDRRLAPQATQPRRQLPRQSLPYYADAEGRLGIPTKEVIITVIMSNHWQSDRPTGPRSGAGKKSSSVSCGISHAPAYGCAKLGGSTCFAEFRLRGQLTLFANTPRGPHPTAHESPPMRRSNKTVRA